MRGLARWGHLGAPCLWGSVCGLPVVVHWTGPLGRALPEVGLWRGLGPWPRGAGFGLGLPNRVGLLDLSPVGSSPAGEFGLADIFEPTSCLALGGA